MERTIQAAKKLDISILNMHMNHGVHFTLLERKVKLFEQYKESYLESIMGFRDMCKQIIGHDGNNKLDHMTLGTGEIDLNGRLDLAKMHNCRCVVETKTVDALRKSIQWLKANNYLEG